MGAILLGILASALSSGGMGYWKKAIDESKLSTLVFNFLAGFLGIIAIFILFLLFDFNFDILKDYQTIGLILLVVGINLFNAPLEIYINKNEKLSALLPYTSLDKIFIIIIGFLLFYNTANSTSIITLFITLSTIGLIIFSNINLGKIRITKYVILFFIFKFFRAFTVLVTGYILVHYSSVDFAIIDWFLFSILSFVVVLSMNHSPKTIFKQSNKFYMNRLIATLLSWSGYILGLYIIEDSGVIVATLLGFFAVAFNILAMKYITKDNPTKKQIILAFVVIIMIGIGYYFK